MNVLRSRGLTSDGIDTILAQCTNLRGRQAGGNRGIDLPIHLLACKNVLNMQYIAYTNSSNIEDSDSWGEYFINETIRMFPLIGFCMLSNDCPQTLNSYHSSATILDKRNSGISRNVVNCLINQPWECIGFWCPSWTSNPVFPATNRKGRFDSDTLPPVFPFACNCCPFRKTGNCHLSSTALILSRNSPGETGLGINCNPS